MYKPFNLDSTRKYPVISYVYPGPQTESVPYQFTVTGGKNIALAQLGFIVVNFGHSGGSPQRSNYYHTFGYDDLRDYALADDKYGIEQLSDNINSLILTESVFMAIQGEDSCRQLQSFHIPIFMTLQFHQPGIMITIFTTSGGVKPMTGWRRLRKKLRQKTDIKKDTLGMVTEKDTISIMKKEQERRTEKSL